MDLIGFLRVVRRRWPVVAIPVVLGIALGAASFFVQGETADVSFYRATHTLTSNGNKTVNLSQLAVLTTESDISRRAAQELGGSPAQLASQVTATAQPEVDLLKVTAVSPDPTRAVQVADTFARQASKYQAELVDREREQQEQQLQAQLDNLRQQYAQVFADAEKEPDPVNRDRYRIQKDQLIADSKLVESQLARLRNQPATPVAVTTISTAEAVPISGKAVAQLFSDQASSKSGSSSSKSSSNQSATLEDTFQTSSPTRLTPLARAGIGGVAGLLLGLALVFGIERLDPRLHTKAEAEEAFGWPVLVEVPPMSRPQRKRTDVLSVEQPRSRIAEAYRSLRSAVLFVLDQTAATDTSEAPKPPSAAPKPRGRVVMVNSASPSEGKTTSTANLAAMLAEADYRVLVVNCDFRRPRIHTYLGVGLEAVTPTPSSIRGVDIVADVAVDGETEPSPASIVTEQRRIIEAARSTYDFVVLDTAPLLSTNDATDVLDEADVVVLVAKTNRTNKEAADRAAELLERRKAPVLGIVLLAATDRPTSRYYYYGDAGRYYADTPIADEQEGSSLSELSQARAGQP